MSEQRLTDLEASYAWLERHVSDQDKVILEMGEEIRRLRRELEKLKAALANAAPAEPEVPEEPPPHY